MIKLEKLKLIELTRFNDFLEFSDSGKKIILRKKINFNSKIYFLIGVDEESVYDVNGIHPIDGYLIGKESDFYTLTQKESDIISMKNPGFPPPDVFEKKNPWVKGIKYINNSKENYKNLIYFNNKYSKNKLDISQFSNAAWNNICNVIRRVSHLDKYFYFASHLPIQDVYGLEEEEDNRHVFSIDFNSIYGSCMQYKFPDPRYFYVKSFQRNLKEGEVLDLGLYRCQLIGPKTNFIKKYNPFKVFFSGKYLSASIDDGVRVDLNDFEIEFYKKHFNLIYLESGVISSKEINHPLASSVREAYSKRLNYKRQKRFDLASKEKTKIVLMSSCSNRPVNSKNSFFSKLDFFSFLKNEYGISGFKQEPVQAILQWLDGRKKISIENKLDTLIINSPKLLSGTACFSFSQRIVARSRIILLEKMEEILKYSKDVRIFYTNTDSIHFSINKDDYNYFYNLLTKKCSSDLGGYKIDADSSYGLWLEPGKYWLYDASVKKFSNKGLGGKINPFYEYKKYVKCIKINDLFIPFPINIRMRQSFSDSFFINENKSKLEKVVVKKNMNYYDVVREIEKNKEKSIEIKMKKFKRIKEVFS